jgi:hypothetical protein
MKSETMSCRSFCSIGYDKVRLEGRLFDAGTLRRLGVRIYHTCVDKLEGSG